MEFFSEEKKHAVLKALEKVGIVSKEGETFVIGKAIKYGLGVAYATTAIVLANSTSSLKLAIFDTGFSFSLRLKQAQASLLGLSNGKKVNVGTFLDENRTCHLGISEESVVVRLPLKKLMKQEDEKIYEYYEHGFIIPGDSILIIPNNASPDTSFEEEEIIILGVEFMKRVGLCIHGKTNDPYCEQYATITTDPTLLKIQWSQMLYEVDNYKVYKSQKEAKAGMEKEKLFEEIKKG